MGQDKSQLTTQVHVSHSSAGTCSIEELERRWLFSTLIINGDSASSNDWLIRLNPANALQIQVIKESIAGAQTQLVTPADLTAVTGIVVHGGAGDDTLTIDDSSGELIDQKSFTFDSGGGTNTLTVVGQSNTSVKVLPATESGAGSIVEETGSLHYTGIGRLSLTKFGLVTVLPPLGPAQLSIINTSDGVAVTGVSGTTQLNTLFIQDVRALVINTVRHESADPSQQDDSITLAGQAKPAWLQNITLNLGRGNNEITDGAAESSIRTVNAGTLDVNLCFSAVVKLFGSQRINGLFLQDASTLRLDGGKNQIVRVGSVWHSASSTIVGRGRLRPDEKLALVDPAITLTYISAPSFTAHEDTDSFSYPDLEITWNGNSTCACTDRFIVQHVIFTGPNNSVFQYWEQWTVNDDGTVDPPEDEMYVCPGSGAGTYSVQGWAWIVTDQNGGLGPFDQGIPEANGLISTTTRPDGWSDYGAAHHGITEQADANNNIVSFEFEDSEATGFY